MRTVKPRTLRDQFEAVVTAPEFGRRADESSAQPVVQFVFNEMTAKIMREFYPLQFQHRSLSEFNPWLAPVAQVLGVRRQAAALENALRISEAAMSGLVGASLDYCHALRDVLRGVQSFTTSGGMFPPYLLDRQAAEERIAVAATDPRELPFVKEALAAIGEGGYAEAFARVAFLLARGDAMPPFSQAVLRQELVKDYADLVPSLPPEQWRRIRVEQEIIARYEPEHSINTLPDLLTHTADRERLVMLIKRVLADRRIQADKPTDEQIAMLERICGVLNDKPAIGTRHARLRLQARALPR